MITCSPRLFIGSPLHTTRKQPIIVLITIQIIHKHEFRARYSDPCCNGSNQPVYLTCLDVMKLVLIVRSAIDGPMVSKQQRNSSNCSISEAAKPHARTRASLITTKVSTNIPRPQECGAHISGARRSLRWPKMAAQPTQPWNIHSSHKGGARASKIRRSTVWQEEL